MVSLVEHVDVLRKLRIPYKKQLVKYCYILFNDHLSGDKGTELADTTGNRMTVDAFIDAIMTREPEAKQ